MWLLACALLFALPAWSQTTGFTGTVTDQSGAVIPGAKVALTNESTGVSRSTTTAADGGFVFTQLEPGRYKVEVSAQGFKTAVREHIAIAVGITSNLDIRLTVGSVAETVTVEAEVTGVNVTDASLGNVISGSQVLELPSVNLDPSGLLSLQPGVTFIPGQADVAGGYSGTNDLDGRGGSVNGARSDQTNITLDGVDVNDPLNGYAFTSVLRATQASLAEFRVTTTNYNADQGRSSGAEVQLVTKSGTNDLHGMAYYTHRNEIFNANDFFLNRSDVERGKFRRHIYGIAAGGPLWKDRLFLFGNWEVLREDLNESIERDVPSETFRDGVMVYECEVPASCPGGTVNGFTGTHTIAPGFYGLTPAEMAAIDPLNAAGEGPSVAASAYFNQFPLPNSTGSFDAVNVLGFRFNSPVANRFHTYILKADYNIDRGGSHKVYWRGTLQNDTITAAGPQFPGLPPNQTRASYNKGFSLGYSALLTPNWVNTFRWGYTRISAATLGNQNTEYVDFRFLSNLQDFASDTLGRILPLHDFRDDVSWTRGKHTFSFGGSMRFVRNNKFSNANSFSFFTGNPSWLPNVGRDIQPGEAACQEAGCTAVPDVSDGFAAAYNDAAIMLLGIVTQATASYNFDRTGATQPIGDPVRRRFATNEFEWYFQDQWRLSPTLTLTAGVRYSLFSPPWETNGNQVQPVLIGGAQSGDGLGEWLDIRRELMLAGLGTNNAPQIGYALGGPANDADHFYPWDRNNWSPRVAVAWAPHFKEGILGTIFGDGKMSIRAGYSLVYDRVGSALVNSFDNAGAFGMSTQIDSVFGGCGEGPSVAGPLGVCPRYAGTFEVGAPTSVAGGPTILGLLPASPGGSFPAIPPGADAMGVPQPGSFAIAVALDNTLQTPYAHTINFSIARELPWNLTVETAYVGRSGRNGLIIRDVAMPADLVDPASGVSYFQAATELIALADQGVATSAVGAIPYWENLFPGLGPTGVNGGALPCSGGVGSATQVAYEIMTCLSHPDTTVFPWLFDQFGVTGFPSWTGIRGSTVAGQPGDPDIDGDGFPDAPFAFFDDQFATLTAWGSTAHSEYHAFQLTLRKRLSQGIAFDLNYTLAKSLDMSSTPERVDLFGGFELGGGYTGTTINTWQPNLEYSFSDYDMRHQFNANWTVEFPFGRGKAFGSDMPTWLDHIVGGWQLSGIVRVNSRLPATVINARVWPTNWDLQGNATCGPRSSFIAVAPCPETSNAHGAVHASTGESSPNLFSDPDAAFDGFRFTLPGQRGERNIVRGDRFFNLDLGLSKTFKMPWEGHAFKLRWEAFNVTNSVFFDTAYLAASIGRKGTFGDYTGVLGGPRRMQISFRYAF